MNRQFPAAAAAALAAGLLIGWNPPLSAARQAPATWTAERRAVFPSGLSAQLDFSAAPGVTVTGGPGELADRSGSDRSTAPYADGIRPGEPAQAFRISEDRPQADGSWRTVGTLRLTFSRAVRNPRLHLSGLTGAAAGNSGSTGTATRLTLIDGAPAAPTLVNRTDWPGWTVDGRTLAPARADGAADGDAGSAAEGSLELVGTVRSAVFRVERRSTARAGSTTAPPPLTQAYTVTLDEGVGSAPQGYGSASHLRSDLYLGGDAATSGARADARPTRLVRQPAAGTTPEPPRLQPGRDEYQGADPAVGFPAEAAVGHDYRLTLPVAVGDAPAVLAGWVDFDRNGRFDPVERVQTEIAPGERSATLEWTVPAGASSGETWARLRIGRDAAQVVPADGFADSGQVLDQRVRLTVGAARPEISQPADGATLTETRPRISGTRAATGATVEVREGDTALCRGRAARGGDWSCRPDTALAEGPHTLTPVLTTGAGAVLRGDPVRLTVRTAAPGTAVLALPESTNDPGIRLTGTGGAGSTVVVTDRTSDGQEADLCSTAVRADGGWSCLPVENLADGRHRLTPSAADLAGNRTAGQPVELVVDTVPPDRPVLTAPAAGETVRAARPRLAGKAEPGARVLVTAGPERGEGAARIVACGATAAVDGSWTCTANRDLTDGEQWLVVTATDLAGNGTAADAVAVRVETAGQAAVPAPVPTSTPTPTSTATASAVPTPAASTATAATPTPVTTPTPTPIPTAQATAAAVPTTVRPSATPSVPAPSVAVPSPATASPVVPKPSAATPARPSPSVPSPSVPAASVPATPSPTVPVPAAVPASVPPGLLPVVVPPVSAVAPAPANPSPTATRSAFPAPVSAARPSSAPTSPSPSSVPTPSLSPTPTVTPFVTPSVTPAPAGPAAASDQERADRAPAAPPPGGSRQSARTTATDAAADTADPTDSAGPADAPEPSSPTASDRHRSDGWRGALAGVLLVLAGIGLITRRVVGRGSGPRRR
ncbi:Ig-like domain-containing protein [Kitasatospora sp. NPDC056184]|uniref:Ig-like domain-containing protein n=1 Tax=Kitasatospora sp. NPDC056184 TaxID=3345738 RepID=UPI0035DB215D